MKNFTLKYIQGTLVDISTSEVIRFKEGSTYALQGDDDAFDADKRAYSVSIIRTQHAKAYAPWTEVEDLTLLKEYGQGRTVKQLAVMFGRQVGAIRSRLRKLKDKD